MLKISVYLRRSAAKMVKFSTVVLPTPSSSSVFHQGLGYRSHTPPSINSKKEREHVDREPARWTDSEEAILIHLMVKEVRKGNKKNTTLSSTAWKTIEQGFYEKTGKQNILPQLKNKFNTLKIRYSDFKKLLKEPGFKWDPAISHATASDDVWEAYARVNKRARVFRQKGCPLYDELEIIYGNPVGESRNAAESIRLLLENEYKYVTEDESTKSSQSDSAKNGGDGIDVIDAEPCTILHDVHLHQQSLPPVDQLLGAMDPIPIAEFIPPALPYSTSKSLFTEVSCPKTSNSSHDDQKSFPTEFSITACVKCLESIQGVDSVTYLKAIKMFKDVDWREMFMAMSAQRRLEWLASL